ncbi:MAG: ferrochelatase [Nitrososphaerales archaeon]
MKVEKKKAIILMAYGSPERPEDIESYYTHIRGGRKPSIEEVENLKARYKSIGGSSPLLKITNSTAKKLEIELQSEGENARIYAGMKHWHPFVSETFEQISRDGVTDLVAVVLAPHYSKMSVGSYQDSVREANAAHGDKVKVTFVNEWHLNPIFLDKWRQRIKNAYERKFQGAKKDQIFFLFSAHSLPEKILKWGDPYKSQLIETSDKLAQMLELGKEQYGFAFQSAGHTSEPWLGPDILDEVRELQRSGQSNILVAPIGFVSDHLEILFDIDVEAKGMAEQLGLRLERTESFNDSDEFIDVLASVVRNTSEP